MHPVSPTSWPRSIFACGCIALLTLLLPSVASAEGISASASVTTPNPATTIDALRQQIAALEKRVTELEKPQAVDVKDDGEQEAAAKKLEQRLASLEKNQEAAKSETSAEKNRSEYDAPLTVKAPFTVVDSDGRPLMRVSEKDGELSRGIYIYNSNGGAVAHMGASSLGTGRVYVSSDGRMPTVGMVVDENGGKFMLYEERNKVFEVTKQSLTLYNTDGAATVVLKTGELKTGKLELADESGAIMVSAGTTNSGVGKVLTGPNGNGAAGTLTGGKAASSISGRVD